MLKPLPNFRGRLAAPLASGSLLMQLNQEGVDGLASLAPGDWVYAAVDDGTSFEVIKVTGLTGSAAAIERAQDATEAATFQSGARVTYTLGEAAVKDIAQEITLAGAQVTGSGIVKVTKQGDWAYNIHADEITLISDDPAIQVFSLYPNFVISKKPDV